MVNIFRMFCDSFTNIQKIFLALGFGSSILFYFTIKQYLKRRKYKHIPGPNTKGLIGFFIGNHSEINSYALEGKTFPDKLLDWSKKYGSIYKFQFIGEIIIVINEETAIKEIAIEKDYPKNHVIFDMASYLYNERFLGNGLVSETNRDKWRIKRKIFNHGFHKNVLINSLKEFNTKADILIQNLRLIADGKTVISLYEKFNRTALDIIASVTFGIDVDSINNSDNKLNLWITKILEGVNIRFKDPLIVFKPNKRKQVNDYRKAIKDLRSFGREMIKERIQECKKNEETSNDMLSIIIRNSKNETLDLETLVDDFITIFIGGQETISNTLAFCFLELGQNYNILEEVKKEIDEKVGLKIHIDYETLSSLNYTNQVFKETLRKWPVVSELYRVLSDELIIKDYRIPKNTWVMLSPYVMSRSERNYPNPDKFIPERFNKASFLSEENNLNSYTFFPFSIGPRSCIGQNFAQIECKLLIAKLIQNFDLILDPTQSLNAVELTTLRPSDGCRVFIKPRIN